MRRVCRQRAQALGGATAGREAGLAEFQIDNLGNLFNI